MNNLVKLSKIITVFVLATSPVFLRASTTTEIANLTRDDELQGSIAHKIGYERNSAPSISPTPDRNYDHESNGSVHNEYESRIDPDENTMSLEKRNYEALVNERMNPSVEQHQDEEVIVIATLDGTFYGISSLTGNALWKSKPSSFDSKIQAGKTSSPKITTSKQEENLFAPLLSTTTTRTNNKSWRTAAVPSMDGRVFLTLGKSLRDTITSNVRELVERSPFMDSKGRFFVSNKKGYAVALNKSTGEVLQTVASEKGVLEKDQLVYLDKGDAFVWIGRVDYEVTVHDARTGEVDVQFSTSEVLGVEDMMQNISPDSVHNTEKLGIQGPLEPPEAKSAVGISNNDMSSALTKAQDRNYKSLTNVFEREQEMHQESENDFLSSIIATPGGRFAKLDSDSGHISWIADQTLSSPVVFAIQATGESLKVHIVPDAPVSNSFSEAYLMSELDRQRKISQDNGSTIFDDETVFGALPNGELFAIPLGSRSKRVTSAYNGLPHVSRLSTSIGSSKTVTAKIPHMAGHGDLFNSFKESTALTTVAKSSPPCDKSSANFAECLRSTYGAVFGDSEAFSYDNPLESIDMITKEFQSKPGRKRSNFVRIMTSWLPPVVALIFVLSFELGRREKARVIAQESSTASITFKRELSDEDLKSSKYHTGVINVSERVLGYGGHGTVVYKGKLDGRFVAVKRMLKAYHASADREISLLIESDGHPNVVRYFLKEIRGDFVYLALELCDMSLQDLIIVLSKHRLKMQLEESNVINKATRKILFEIASGVKHIHSLRIVHRDLKPANILLARSSKKSKVSLPMDDDKMYRTYEAGEYIPKISDMGLGKQLAGHSSFGFSTFNSMGPDLMGNDASTIAGAGPGSVGWQAPEVMAQRLTPESILEDSSGPESWLEASPIDISLNTRTSRSVDIFSLGCIFYCTLIPGSHPFGQWYEREANIMKGNTSTDLLKDVSMEAWDLITAMLSRNPGSRPTAAQVCNHPFFWSSAKRLAFLCEFSDRLETEIDTSTPFYVLDKLVVERQAHNVVGTSWDKHIDSRLLNNIQKYRTYDTSSVRDCLRLLRNKHHHFDELPSDLRESTIPTQNALLDYFEKKFPKLLYHCYSICKEYLQRDDPLIVKYDITRKLPSVSILKDRRSVSKINSLNADQSNIIDAKLVDVAPTVLDGIHEPDLKQDDDNIDTLCDEDPKSDISSYDVIDISKDIIIWQSSTASNSLNCRGWIRSEDEWIRRTNEKIRKRDPNLIRCIEDPKFRTRLCNHWENSNGVNCPMLKKHKCIFAHHPSELRVKDGKRGRWGKLVDAHGNANNPFHSGGEDTYSAAKTIESARKDEGKWKLPSTGKKKKHLNRLNAQDNS